MPKSSQRPLAGLSGFPSEPPTKHARLQTVPPPQPAAAPAESTVLPISGPRKLVRPTLSSGTLSNRAFRRRDDPPVLTYQQTGGPAAVMSSESSNAEAFYFQKQVQAQTRMVIVLDDGQQIEGCIEWYDRNSIKVRGASRMLIYKTGIKYMYKAAEKHI